MTIVESAVKWAIETANDNRHGYSQVNRWGETGDYDCSSFVITAYRKAGLKLAGATFTGNMRQPFLNDGFVDVTTQVGIKSGYGIQAGDVLLNYAAHTCIAIGNGKVANCRTSEGNYQAGDQSGNEIRIQQYWDGTPNVWNCVLRYKGKNSGYSDTETAKNENQTQNNADIVEHKLKLPVIRYGQRGNEVALMQALLNARCFNCGAVDGDYGAKTQAALNAFQKYSEIAVDGVCGAVTWQKLFEIN